MNEPSCTEFGISKQAFTMFMIADSLLCLVGIGLLLFPYHIAIYKKHRLIIDGQKVTYKRGVVGSYTQELPLDKINGINVQQGMVARWLRYGRLQIVTGNDIDAISFDLLERPHEAKALIDQLRNSTAAPPTKIDYTDQITALAGLLQKGYITQAEYDAKKKQLLDL